MSSERLDRHAKVHHELFDEDTATVGSLGDVVEKHAGDSLFLAEDEPNIGGADGGESDFEVEMNSSDPDDQNSIDQADLFTDPNDEYAQAADQTGTVAGIARGFGTHLPQDLGRKGFEIETIPTNALNTPRRPVGEGDELDDYDDDKQ